jgi:hypothetical protein
MTSFHQFSVFAASRGEGLHPKLRALLERAAASPFSEVSRRHDGLIQAGPNPDSEVVASRVNVTAASVLRTTPPNERCGVWRSEEETELSPVQTLAVIVPPPSIP